jgi:hypothetical protein
MTERPPVNVVNVAAGLCFVALGILLLLHRQGYMELRQILDLWPVALVVLGGALAWQATRGGDTRGNSGGAIAALVWLGLIGLLFGYTADRTRRAEAEVGPGRVAAVAIMGGQQQFDRTGPLESGLVTTVMGGARLDLRQMTIAPGEHAVLDIFTVFGGTEIHVPPEWHVETNMMTVMGGVSDERLDWSDTGSSQVPAQPADSDQPVQIASTERPKLVITGTIVMGGLKLLN